MGSYRMMVAVLLMVSCSCNKAGSGASSKTAVECLEGRLVKRGICGQYVIEVLSPGARGMEVAASWNDPSSGISYKNVFTVANPCDFPGTIKQGDAFRFAPGTSGKTACGLCEAYTPTPAAKNVIFINCPSK